jgi:hypothetical protein
MKENIVKDKSFAFALRVIKLAKFLEMRKGNLYYRVSFSGAERQLVHWCARQSTQKAKRILFTK